MSMGKKRGYHGAKFTSVRMSFITPVQTPVNLTTTVTALVLFLPASCHFVFTSLQFHQTLSCRVGGTLRMVAECMSSSNNQRWRCRVRSGKAAQ